MHIFDFDGTIVDCWNRYYNVFVLLNGLNNSLISFSDYKNAKLEFEKDELVANHFRITLNEDYFEKKSILLESIDLLKYDTLIVEKEELIHFFSINNSIILTKRNNASSFYDQLDILGLNKLIDKCYIVNGNQNKLDYFKNKFIDSSNCIYGDSFEEYRFSELISNKVYMVKSGLKDVTKYKHKDNVYIIDDIGKIINQI